MPQTEHPAKDDMTDRQYNTLVKLGHDLRSLYIDYRRRLPGKSKYQMDGKTWPDTFWFNTAKKIMAKGINPQLYVELIFRRYYPQYPMPQILWADSSFQYYAERYGGPEGVSTAEHLIASQNRLVEAELRFGRTMREVLTEPPEPLNPVFSYCLAVSAGLPDLVDQFKEQAMEFLRVYPQYRLTVLKEYLPEEAK